MPSDALTIRQIRSLAKARVSAQRDSEYLTRAMAAVERHRPKSADQAAALREMRRVARDADTIASMCRSEEARLRAEGES